MLIIEDQRDVAEPLRQLLEREGHLVQIADDGAKGLELARTQQPDVVLCDNGLPEGMDGYEVAAALKKNPETRRALLIAVTGYGREDDRVRGKLAGFDHYLAKPVNFGSLRTLIAERSSRPT